jgi:myo-inositol-1(or 4)-monophosphatase
MTLDSRQLDEILAAIHPIADEVGALLRGGLDGPKTIDHKGEVDLVTDFDRRAQDLIAGRLSQRFPEFALIAEEGEERAAEEPATTWIVDPLDGTTNFSHGHPLFAVSIGLEHHGELVAGVIDAPALRSRFWARAGGGAFRDGKPVRVSATADLDQALLATGFPYDRRTARDDNTREFVGLMKRAQGIRRGGAAAIDLALTACGVYDAFWEPRLHAWDLAAGVVIVREAGGKVSGYDGEPVDIRSGWIAASNGLIHDAVLETIRVARADL